jgi:hypothetical protein
VIELIALAIAGRSLNSSLKKKIVEALLFEVLLIASELSLQ